MIKKTFLLLIIATSFISGFALNNILNKSNKHHPPMKRVTGIGGIFFKCKDPEQTKNWYKTHLGIDAGDYGATFTWREDADSTKKGQTLWTPFAEKSKYFEPSSKDFMINYRVENLEALVAELKKENVTVLDEIATYDFGKFVHILDADGNKIELWEPIDK